VIPRPGAREPIRVLVGGAPLGHGGPRLTGMGTDAAAGAVAIARAAGRVLVQDELSSSIHGMPRAALETGCVNAIVSLDRLADALQAGLADPRAYRDRARRVV
jgi:CheB methylesterase